MFARLRRHLTYANVLATLALAFALGGGAYAATALPKKSVGTAQLKNNAVTTKKIKRGAVTRAKIAPGVLPTNVSTRTTLQVPLESWVSEANNDPASSVAVATNNAALRGASSSPQTFLAGVTLPSTLQGRAVTVKSFDLCYDGGALAVLDEVFLDRTDATATTWQAVTKIDDTTDRIDSTCRTYSAASPIAIGPTQGIFVGVKAKYPSGASEVGIGRLTLHLGT